MLPLIERQRSLQNKESHQWFPEVQEERRDDWVEHRKFEVAVHYSV